MGFMPRMRVTSTHDVKMQKVDPETPGKSEEVVVQKVAAHFVDAEAIADVTGFEAEQMCLLVFYSGYRLLVNGNVTIIKDRLERHLELSRARMGAAEPTEATAPAAAPVLPLPAQAGPQAAQRRRAGYDEDLDEGTPPGVDLFEMG
jgi:hypothetical protein